MSNYLDQLVELIPENAPRPSAEDIRVIHDIDQAISGRGSQLRMALSGLEKEIAPSLAISQRPSFDGFRGTSLGSVPNDWAPVPGEHQRRINMFGRVLNPLGLDIKGGLKSPARIDIKLAFFDKEKRAKNMPDISRGRTVCATLEELDRTYAQLDRARGSQDLPFTQVGHFNFYHDRNTKYPTPYRALHTHWVNGERSGNETVDTLVTEVQLLTRRVGALLDLNHPFDVTKEAKYPTIYHRAWVHRLLLKASILDLEEYKA